VWAALVAAVLVRRPQKLWAPCLASSSELTAEVEHLT
jgi:hypothetical protein